jgi:flagellar hook-basal body complex protein FliE
VDLKNTAITPALAAYARALEQVRSPTPAPGAPLPARSFAELLADTLQEAVDSGRQGEAAATRATLGQASLQDVVEAVNAAELSLRTVVAVRDRMIAAYQDIMRMPI